MLVIIRFLNHELSRLDLRDRFQIPPITNFRDLVQHAQTVSAVRSLTLLESWPFPEE